MPHHPPTPPRIAASRSARQCACGGGRGLDCPEACRRLRDHYEPGYARNDQFNAGIHCRPEVEARLAQHAGSSASVLHWGGDTGINTPLAATAGTLHVLDISDRPAMTGAQRASRNEISVHDYARVTCGSVIEHLPCLDFPFEDLMRGSHAD